jgi:hypothetical protein
VVQPLHPYQVARQQHTEFTTLNGSFKFSHPSGFCKWWRQKHFTALAAEAALSLRAEAELLYLARREKARELS